MREYGFSLIQILKFIRENTGLWKTVFLHILWSGDHAEREEVTFHSFMTEHDEPHKL